MNRIRLALVALLVTAPLPALAAENFLDRARDAVREAGRKIDDAAKDAGRSVRDFLTDNPDLNRDIVEFGAQVGVPGFDGARPSSGPSVALSVPEAVAGTELTVTVAGLPGETAVTVAAGPSPAEARRLAETKTDARGTARRPPTATRSSSSPRPPTAASASSPPRSAWPRRRTRSP